MHDMIQALSSDPGIAIGALAIVVGTLAIVIISLGHVWRKVRQAEDLNALKQDMVDRGMTADEIATVIKATPGGRAPGGIELMIGAESDKR